MSTRSLVEEFTEELFASTCTPEYVAAVEADGYGAELWARVDELGLTLPAVPEELGGDGATLVEQVEVLLAAGRHAAPLPLLETGLLGGWLLARAGLTVPRGPLAVAPSTDGDRLALARDGDGWRLSGTAEHVPSASIAERLVVLAQDAGGAWRVALVATADCDVAPGRNLAGERRDAIRFAGVPLAPEQVRASPVDREQLLRRASFGRCVLMLGALESLRELAISYARERRQFGQPLARFQAVQAMLAAIAGDVAIARAAVEQAVDDALADELSLLDVASATVACAGAATRAGAAAHQLHGAIGVTREHRLQLLTRRLWAWRDEGRPAGEWARALGAWLLLGTDDVWSTVVRAGGSIEREEHAGG